MLFVSMPGGLEWLIVLVIGVLTLGLPCAVLVALVFLLRNRRETRCRQCGCILRGLSEPKCPHCGEPI